MINVILISNDARYCSFSRDTWREVATQTIAYIERAERYLLDGIGDEGQLVEKILTSVNNTLVEHSRDYIEDNLENGVFSAMDRLIKEREQARMAAYFQK